MGLMTKPHQSAIGAGAGGEEIDTNLVDAKSFGHWDFLEEIEAPMWADLISEAESSCRDTDDEWFHVSHPFHQCSSRKLRSAVSITGEEGCKNSGQDPPSPKLPTSVSKSRGKDYKSREWGQNKATLSKQHPVKKLISRSSLVISGSGNGVKPISRTEKSQVNKGSKASSSSLVTSGSGNGVKPISRTDKSQANKGSKASSISESGVTEVTGPNCSGGISYFGESKSHSSSLVCQHGGSNSTSTITSEVSAPQQSKSFEVSNQLPSRTSELLTTLRTSLRKSCATRQASRVEVNGGRKSEGCKSSSSKSSVGSSSHPGLEDKNPVPGETQNKEKTPDSRNVMRVSQVPKIKSKLTTVSKGPALQVWGASSTLRRGNEIATSKETTKAKAQKKSLHTKVLVPHKVNEQIHLNATKTRIDDKKTPSGLVAASQKSYADRAGRCISQLQKPAKKGVAEKCNKIGAKEKKTDQSEGKENKNVVKKEKKTDQSEVKENKNVVKKVYFR